MRKQMVTAVSEVLEKDEQAVLFLVDIGVWAFREVLRRYPERAMNAGIFEDGLVSVAAGTALRGMTPILYGISPFILVRALEQLKLDFLYQKVGGNFITTGASYDFPALGYSHYCPEDVEILKALPGFQIITPGTGTEFARLFQAAYQNGSPTYFRLSDYPNQTSYDVEFGKAYVIQKGSKATVIAVGTMLDLVVKACCDYDVTILYYTTLEPFDHETLLKLTKSRKILLCEPHYSGSLYGDVIHTFPGERLFLQSLGVPRSIDRTYGTKKEKDGLFGFTEDNIKVLLELMLKE